MRRQRSLIDMIRRGNITRTEFAAITFALVCTIAAMIAVWVVS